MEISESNRQKVNTLTYVFWITCGITLLKISTYFITHSTAILTDALESIINVIAAFFALKSAKWALQPKDLDHPYGHGKIEFLSAGFEGAMILLAGIFILIKSVYDILYPQTLHQLDIGFVLVSFTALVNFIMGKKLLSIGSKNQSILMKASGKHLISDTISSLGLLLGLVVIKLTGITLLDPIIAILFGIYIIYTGQKLVKESVSNLLDEADLKKIEEIIEVLKKYRKENWIDVHNLRLQKYGSESHIDCHVTLPFYMSLEESHKEIRNIENFVAEQVEGDLEMFIHSDPCVVKISCTICGVSNCSYRKAEQIKKLEWNLGNLLPNKKHGF
jgi:cation diffusion facilitator family transporter